jgi:hypothetical protein
MLQSEQAPKRADVRQWSENLVLECRSRLSAILPLSSREVEFLTTLNDKGEIVSELLTEDPNLQAIIRSHPGLLWKVQNVREYMRRGGPDSEFQS